MKVNFYCRESWMNQALDHWLHGKSIHDRLELGNVCPSSLETQVVQPSRTKVFRDQILETSKTTPIVVSGIDRGELLPDGLTNAQRRNIFVANLEFSVSPLALNN